MTKRRRRFKQSLSLEERLSEDSKVLREKLDTSPPGAKREELLRRIRQNDVAVRMSEWLRSPATPA